MTMSNNNFYDFAFAQFQSGSTADLSDAIARVTEAYNDAKDKKLPSYQPTSGLGSMTQADSFDDKTERENFVQRSDVRAGADDDDFADAPALN